MRCYRAVRSTLTCSFNEISDLLIINFSFHCRILHTPIFEKGSFCLDMLIIDKKVVDVAFVSRFKQLEISDRGSLKYLSKIVLETVVILGIYSL